MRWSRLVFAVTVAAMSACSSAARGGEVANVSRFERNLGTGSPIDIVQRSDKILSKYQFELQQRGEPPNLYIETKWRTRSPFEDEQALGVTSAQTRAIVRGTRRVGGSNSEIYSVDLTIENRVQRDGNATWYDNVATRQYLAFANQITADLKYELEIGVRR